jgi:hypothetical protein
LILFELIALLLPFVAIGILYPDDPANRRARTVRAVATVFALSVAIGAMQAVLTGLSYGSINAPESLATIVLVALLSAIPVSAAERIAGLFHPRRTPGWALGGVAACLAWAGLLHALLQGTGSALSRWAVIVEFTLPGIVAGLTWHALLPPREANVGRIFE